MLHFLGQGYLKGFPIFVNFLAALPWCVLKSFCLMRNIIVYSWMIFKNEYFRLSINVKILCKMMYERSNCHKIHTFVIWVFLMIKCTDFWSKVPLYLLLPGHGRHLADIDNNFLSIGSTKFFTFTSAEETASLYSKT